MAVHVGGDGRIVVDYSKGSSMSLITREQKQNHCPIFFVGGRCVGESTFILTDKHTKAQLHPTYTLAIMVGYNSHHPQLANDNRSCSQTQLGGVSMGKLFWQVHKQVMTEGNCPCSSHPQLPEADLEHKYLSYK